MNKTFNLDKEDVRVLEEISKKLNISESDVVRIAIRFFVEKFREDVKFLMLAKKLNELELNDFLHFKLYFHTIKSLLEVSKVGGGVVEEVDKVIKWLDDKINQYKEEIERQRRMLLTINLVTGGLISGESGSK